MAINLPSCFLIQFLEQLLKFLVNFTLLKYVKSQRSYGFLITKELIFGFQILDLKDHFSASLSPVLSLFSGTVKCKILRASGHFAPCTSTRALPWTHWGAYSTPRPPGVLSNDLRSLCTLKNIRVF